MIFSKEIIHKKLIFSKEIIFSGQGTFLFERELFTHSIFSAVFIKLCKSIMPFGQFSLWYLANIIKAKLR